MATLSVDISFRPFSKGSSLASINIMSVERVTFRSAKPRLARLTVHAQDQDQGRQAPDIKAEAEDKTPPGVKRALERARAYKKKKSGDSDQNDDSHGGDAVSDSPKAKGTGEEKAYQKQQTEKSSINEDNIVEVEIITRDGVITRKVTRPDAAYSNVKDYRNKGISSMDFVGLQFSEKKNKKRGSPTGLNVGVEALPSGPLPEVQIITGNAAKLGAQTPALDDDGSGLYKPKVATWGVFPRPENISKTYGGGKVIRPGEALETEEQRAAREARTKQLLDDYKEKMGLNVDPKVKAKYEQVLKEGDCLMDSGRLREALVYYERIMKEMIFQSELHGLAALQWSVCQDSLSRSYEARVMYEKLRSHPNHSVRKKAKQFIFSFQAMEKMRISDSYTLNTTGYQKYFEAFANGYNSSYRPTEEEKIGDEKMGQSLPYVIFLLFPIVLVFTAAVSKGL